MKTFKMKSIIVTMVAITTAIGIAILCVLASVNSNAMLDEKINENEIILDKDILLQLGYEVEYKQVSSSQLALKEFVVQLVCFCCYFPFVFCFGGQS